MLPTRTSRTNLLSFPTRKSCPSKQQVYRPTQDKSVRAEMVCIVASFSPLSPSAQARKVQVGIFRSINIVGLSHDAQAYVRR